MNIEQGLDFILGHFEKDFPRTISTQRTQNRQVLVDSKEQALELYRLSDNLDCRISAFSEGERYKLEPNLIFVDLDNRAAKNEVLALFHKTIGGIPTILDTGHGYAVIQPIQISPFQGVTYKTKDSEELSKLFLQWSERYLSNSKCDSANHPSLKSCMIRIPGSVNSKKLSKDNPTNLTCEASAEVSCSPNGEQLRTSKIVSIVCEWNKQRPTVENLPFRKYLDRLIKKEQRWIKRNSNMQKGEIKYIENLLKQKPQDGKQRIFAMILCPYLANVKQLPLEECESILSNYFGNYIPKQLIRYKLKEVSRKGILPYGISKMQDHDPELYNIIINSKKEVL